MESIDALPSEFGFCRLIPNFLSADECSELKHRCAELVSANADYPPSYRNNQRVVFDDPYLAGQLGQRLSRFLGASIQFENASFAGINPRWRSCRYEGGQRFNLHQDGVFHFDAQTKSRLTFMIYLDDGTDFEGGDTIFYAGGPGSAGSNIELGRIRPAKGAAIVFSHALWHAGDTVTAGSKQILRSDLLYRDHVAPATTQLHRGYVFSLAALDADVCASSGRDCSIRLWNRKSDSQIAELRAHRQSVLKVISTQQQHLVAISRDRSLSLWHWPTLTLIHHLRDCFDATPLDLIESGEGRFAVTDADGYLSVFQNDSGQFSIIERVKICPSWIWAIKLLPGGVYALACEDGVLRTHGSADRLLLGFSGTQLCLGEALRSLAVRSLHANAADLYCGDVSGQIHQLRWKNGILRKLCSWQAHRAAVRCLRLDEQGQLWSGSEDNHLRVWKHSAKQDSAQETQCVGASTAPTLAHSFEFDAFVTDVLLSANELKAASYSGITSLPVVEKI